MKRKFITVLLTEWIGESSEFIVNQKVLCDACKRLGIESGIQYIGKIAKTESELTDMIENGSRDVIFTYFPPYQYTTDDNNSFVVFKSGKLYPLYNWIDLDRYRKEDEDNIDSIVSEDGKDIIAKLRDIRIADSAAKIEIDDSDYDKAIDSIADKIKEDSKDISTELDIVNEVSKSNGLIGPIKSIEFAEGLNKSLVEYKTQEDIKNILACLMHCKTNPNITNILDKYLYDVDIEYIINFTNGSLHRDNNANIEIEVF